MKFAILGTGGTGGCLGAYLAHAGNDVTFLARGKNLQALRENGITIRRDAAAELRIPQVKSCTLEEYRDTPDVIFVCFKYNSLQAAIDFARRTADKETLIIPILNVFGTGGVMQQKLPGLTCLDGCIYIWARREAPGIIAQSGKILRVFFGFRRGQDDRLRAKAAETERILRAADIHAHFTDTIERDALQKFAFVSPMGAAGLFCDAVSGDMQPGGRARDTFIALIEEIKALGAAMGLTFEKDLVTEGLRIMDASAPTLTTSMQRDVAAGHPSEFSGLVDRVVALGEKYHVPVPLYTKISAWGHARKIK